MKHRAKFIGIVRSLQVGPVFLSLFDSRSTAPRGNFCMIAADQHIRHFPAAIFSRSACNEENPAAEPTRSDVGCSTLGF